ncbi:Fic family protein [Nannocystis radixulma]|uniref:Fic family protein n=1 Tax=Nannocystis radixulma TaxID=2995305 RepID=A0ABT5BL44_9BACT|nr:Fic family protein [Nannocystis radixulma]MDC0673747.1 Fic family protein [Nannocystis radixulma]
MLRLAGYAHLLGKHAVDAPALLHASALDEVSARRAVAIGMTVEETFPNSYDPGDDDIDHLIFALKYDGVDLVALARLFRVLDRDALTRRIAEQPTSKYVRRLFFLYERLTGEALSIADLTKGSYIPVLDPGEHFVSAGRPVARHRVIDNMLGDAGFCPIVRRTPTLEAAIRKDLGARAREITRKIDPLLLSRAISFLYTKETKSSFAIEHEEIESGARMERFLAQLAAVGDQALDSEELLTELHRAFVDPRYAEDGFRKPGAREVYVGETIGFREKVHHVGARSVSTPELMAAWARMRPVEGPGGPVLEAACRAFAFVFIHPFGDGNGRIHRLLLHNVLALRGYLPPRLIVPISAVLLADPQGYDRALESFSRRVLPLVDYKLDADGELTIRNDTDDLYRYPELTTVCEATFGWLEQAIEVDLVAELDFLRRFDEVRAGMRAVVEMPDRKEQNFIKICLANGGKLSARKRGYFAELDDATITALEAIVRNAMKDSISDPPSE